MLNSSWMGWCPQSLHYDVILASGRGNHNYFQKLGEQDQRYRRTKQYTPNGLENKVKKWDPMYD